MPAKKVYPGFIDAHCHMGLAEEGLNFEGDDLNEITDPVTPHLRGIDAINPLNQSFDEALDAAVTTVVTGYGKRQRNRRTVCCHQNKRQKCRPHDFKTAGCHEVCTGRESEKLL